MMADYRNMYTILCAAIDRVIDPLEQIPQARPFAAALHRALERAEEVYVDTETEDERPEERSR